jgi:hypothetical protein
MKPSLHFNNFAHLPALSPLFATLLPPDPRANLCAEAINCRGWWWLDLWNQILGSAICPFDFAIIVMQIVSSSSMYVFDVIIFLHAVWPKVLPMADLSLGYRFSDF